MPKGHGLLFFLSTSLAFAQSITIPNNSFEEGTLPLNIGLGPYSNVLAGSTVPTGGTLPNWTAAGTTNNAAAGAYASTSSDPSPSSSILRVVNPNSSLDQTWDQRFGTLSTTGEQPRLVQFSARFTF